MFRRKLHPDSTTWFFTWVEVCWSCLRLRALEHNQLPFSSNLVETQDIEMAVVTLDLEVAVVRAMPLIEVINYLDLTCIQAKSSGHFDSAVASIGLNPNSHGCVASIS